MSHMTDGKIVGDRIVIVLDHVRYHFLHGARPTVGSIVGKLPDYESGKGCKSPVKFHGIKDTLGLIDRLGYIFNEKYASGTDNVEGSTDESSLQEWSRKAG